MILLKEDLIKTYADKRKDISYEEVEDLLNSMISYIKEKTAEVETTEIYLKNVGTLHRIIEHEYYKEVDISFNSKKNTKMMIAEALGNDLYSAKKKRKQKHEIQQHVNNHHPIKN